MSTTTSPKSGAEINAVESAPIKSVEARPVEIRACDLFLVPLPKRRPPLLAAEGRARVGRVPAAHGDQAADGRVQRSDASHLLGDPVEVLPPGRGAGEGRLAVATPHKVDAKQDHDVEPLRVQALCEGIPSHIS